MCLRGCASGRQLTRSGLYSCADPHPGNIAVTAEGDLVFYDFGMMCETAKSKDDLLEVFFGIYEKDSNKVDTRLLLLSVAVESRLFPSSMHGHVHSLSCPVLL